MGYSLTFGMIYGDDQRLNSNHNNALEMILLGDLKGYLLTFGMIFDNDQNLNSSHNYTLEITFRSQNQYIDLVIK